MISRPDVEYKISKYTYTSNEYGIEINYASETLSRAHLLLLVSPSKNKKLLPVERPLNYRSMVNDLINKISDLQPEVTSLKIDNLFEIIKNKKDLAILFAAIPRHVQIVDFSLDDKRNSTEEGEGLFQYYGLVKETLISLPFSVANVILPDFEEKKTINMTEFRNENYFPEEYHKIVNAVPLYMTYVNNQNLDLQARALLADYSKKDDWWPNLSLFCSFHMGRHYTNEINSALDSTDTFDALYLKLIDIRDNNPDFNPIGSLARRIRYIEKLAYNSKIPLPKKNNGLKLDFVGDVSFHNNF